MNEGAIKDALYDWLSKQLGKEAVVTIDFDADFVAGNLIDGTLNGVAWPTVAFDTDHDTTLFNLADEFSKYPEVLTALVTGPRQITVTGAFGGVDLVFVGPTVTGGASQPVATVQVVQAMQAVQVIFSEQNAPRPNYPYAVIRLDSYRRVGYDSWEGVDPITKTMSVGGQRQMTVTVDYFGAKPAPGEHSTLFEETVKAHRSLQKDSVLIELGKAGIAVQVIEDIQNLTQLLETIFEERTSFDFFIGIAENYRDNVGYIHDVTFQGTVNENQQPPYPVQGP